MASPLANINSIPPSAINNPAPRRLAFDRPVQAAEHANKQLPSPEREPAHPLPAVQKRREEIFERACNAGNEAQVQHLLTTAPSLTACKNYDSIVREAVSLDNSGIVDLLLEFKKNNAHEYMALLGKAASEATMRGNIDMVQALLKKGAPMQADSTNLLYLAVHFARVEIAEFLLREGASLEIGACNDPCGLTPLLSTTIGADDGYDMHWLLAKGADPNRRRGNTGLSALAMACDYGNLAKVKILLEAGALVDRGAYEGATPLALAVEKGHEEVVRHLLRCGADVNAACQPSQAPLYKAVANEWFELSKVLLLAGAAADLRCEHEVRETPLMITVQKGNDRIAELLVDHGADIHKPGAEGFSALELAVRAGFDRITEMLREKAAQQAARAGAEPQPVEP